MCSADQGGNRPSRSTPLSLIPSRFGLRAKLLTGASVLLAFTATVGVLGIRGSDSAAARTSKLYTQGTQPLAELGAARANFNDIRALLGSHILEDSAAGRATMQAKIAADDAAIAKSLDAAGKTLETPRQKQAFAALQRDLSGFSQAKTTALELSNKHNGDEAYAFIKKTVRPRVQAAESAFNVLFDEDVKLGAQEAANAKASASAMRRRSLLLLGGALLIGFAMA